MGKYEWEAVCGHVKKLKVEMWEKEGRLYGHRNQKVNSNVCRR